MATTLLWRLKRLERVGPPGGPGLAARAAVAVVIHVSAERRFLLAGEAGWARGDPKQEKRATDAQTAERAARALRPSGGKRIGNRATHVRGAG